MPEINLIKDTMSPDLPPPKPRPVGQPQMTDPAVTGGMGNFFKQFFGTKQKPAAPAATRMGLGRSAPSQRIIKEVRTAAAPTKQLDTEEPGGFDVNLLSEDLYTEAKPRQRLILLAVWAAGAAALVGLAYGGLALVEKSITDQITTGRDELTRVKKEIVDLKGEQDRVTTSTKKIAMVSDLVDRHVKWTNFFSRFENYTLPEVHFGPAFSGDIGGQLTLSAQTDSYENVARQYLVYQQAVERGDFLSAFSITGAALKSSDQGTSVYFNVSLTVSPDAFENIIESEQSN